MPHFVSLGDRVPHRFIFVASKAMLSCFPSTTCSTHTHHHPHHLELSVVEQSLRSAKCQLDLPLNKITSCTCLLTLLLFSWALSIDFWGYNKLLYHPGAGHFLNKIGLCISFGTLAHRSWYLGHSVLLQVASSKFPVCDLRHSQLNMLLLQTSYFI